MLLVWHMGAQPRAGEVDLHKLCGCLCERTKAVQRVMPPCLAQQQRAGRGVAHTEP